MLLLPPAHENISLLRKKKNDIKCLRWGWDYEEIKNPSFGIDSHLTELVKLHAA